eukprot:2326289-Alexandrium_andersonii.AAC.1
MRRWAMGDVGRLRAPHHLPGALRLLGPTATPLASHRLATEFRRNVSALAKATFPCPPGH